MQATPPDTSPLSALGFSAAQEHLYRTLLRNSGCTLAELAALVSAPVERLREDVGRISALGLVELRDDSVVALPPQQALTKLIGDETRRLRTARDQLDSLHGLVPSLTAEHLSSQAPAGQPVTGEIVRADDVVDVIRSLAPNCSGDLLWMRPDQWRSPEGAVVDRCVMELMRAGRRSRAIYPAQVLQEAPGVVRERSAVGEHVRVLAHVPWRIAVLGDAAAMLPQDLAVPRGPVLVVRQQAVIEVLRQLFETMWDKAMAVPGLDGRRDDGGADDRQLLLDQLAGGAKDEQIARALGLGLRTVRRRVAEVLDELGAESRFQAGAEAVRRGWL
jgi:hypothetical protein